jgi:tetratricopeptide (TPR) repeat protein
LEELVLKITSAEAFTRAQDLAEAKQIDFALFYLYLANALGEESDGNEEIEQLSLALLKQLSSAESDQVNVFGICYANRLIATEASAENYVSRGNWFLRAKYYKSALADFRTAKELNPDNYDAYIGGATACFYLKDYDTYLVICNSALKKWPNDVRLLNLRGVRNLKAGRFRFALNDFQLAITLHEKEARSLNDLDRLYFNLAYAHKDAGNEQQALRVVKVYVQKYGKSKPPEWTNEFIGNSPEPARQELAQTQSA